MHQLSQSYIKFGLKLSRSFGKCRLLKRFFIRFFGRKKRTRDVLIVNEDGSSTSFWEENGLHDDAFLNHSSISPFERIVQSTVVFGMFAC